MKNRHRVGWLGKRGSRRSLRRLGDRESRTNHRRVERTYSPIGEIIPVWVKHIPDELESGKLYINATARTLRHLCPCGCGETVTTSVHPEGWVMLFDGVHVTLEPSIGNPHQWCRSHYYIIENRVVWCESPVS